MMNTDQARAEIKKLAEDPKIIGCVSVNKPVFYLDSSFECAAWWEKRESTTGIFPLTLRRNYHSPHYLYALAEVPAEVVDDYFPALFGGVAVSNKPYKPKYIGQKRTINLSKSLFEVIAETGRIPKEPDVDWYMAPEHWHVALEEAETELKDAYKSLPHWWGQYEAGEDRFNSRVGMVGHFGEILAKRSKEIGEIKRYMQYLNIIPDGRNGDMFLDLHNKNCKLARDFLKLGEFKP